MPKRTPLLALALMGAAVSAALAGHTPELAPLAAAVEARRQDAGPGASPRALRALDSAAQIFAEPSASVGDDLRIAFRASRKLRRLRRADPLLDDAFESAVGALGDLAVEQRSALELWSGALADDAQERRLAAAVRAFERRLAQAYSARGPSGRARALALGCRRVARTAEALGIDLTERPKVPDFALLDENVSSPTHGESVSPREFEGHLTGWYFGHST